MKGFYCCSIAKPCPTLCDPMDCSTPGFPVNHQLLELAQTHVHWVGDAIQPSHPLLPSSPPAFNLSQHRVFANELTLCIRWPKYWRGLKTNISGKLFPSLWWAGLPPVSQHPAHAGLLPTPGTLTCWAHTYNLASPAHSDTKRLRNK